MSWPGQFGLNDWATSIIMALKETIPVQKSRRWVAINLAPAAVAKNSKNAAGIYHERIFRNER